MPPPWAGRGYREGLLVNAVNPKTALFMSALLPQFVTPDSPWWLPGVLIVVTPSSVSPGRPVTPSCSPRSVTWCGGRASGAIDGLMGTVLIGFGVRLAASQQP